MTTKQKLFAIKLGRSNWLHPGGIGLPDLNTAIHFKQRDNAYKRAEEWNSGPQNIPAVVRKIEVVEVQE